MQGGNTLNLCGKLTVVNVSDVYTQGLLIRRSQVRILPGVPKNRVF